MSKRVLLVVPEAPPVQGAAGATQRRLSTDGVRLGILDNSKGNADHLLRLVVEGMRATDVPIKSVVSLRKGSVSLPAPRKCWSNWRGRPTSSSARWRIEGPARRGVSTTCRN